MQETEKHDALGSWEYLIKKNEAINTVSPLEM